MKQLVFIGNRVIGAVIAMTSPPASLGDSPAILERCFREHVGKIGHVGSASDGMQDPCSAPPPTVRPSTGASGFRTEGQLVAGFWMWVTLSPIYIVFGSVGNVLSILVLCRGPMIQRVSSVYLIALTAADLLLLNTGLLISWLEQVLQQDLTDFSDVGCKLRFFQIHFLRDVSAWVLVTITLERVVATRFLFKYKLLCTRRSACLSLLAIALSALVVNGHFLVGVGLVPISSQSENETVGVPPVMVCAPILKYEEFVRIWPIIHLCKSCILPAFLMVSGSLLILWDLVRIRNNTVTPLQTIGATRRSFPAMSRLLLGLNLMFICTTVPVFFYQSIEPFFYVTRLPSFIKARDPVFAALAFLTNLNSAMNFTVYCFMGSRFRVELKTMLKSAKNRFFPNP